MREEEKRGRYAGRVDLTRDPPFLVVMYGCLGNSFRHLIPETVSLGDFWSPRGMLLDQHLLSVDNVDSLVCLLYAYTVDGIDTSRLVGLVSCSLGNTCASALIE